MRQMCRLKNASWSSVQGNLQVCKSPYLEGQLADEELSRLLVLTDLTESDSSWPVPATLRAGSLSAVCRNDNDI